jgi:hypothetical protein
MSTYKEALTGLVNAANARMLDRFRQLADAKGLSVQELINGRPNFEGSHLLDLESVIEIPGELPTDPDSIHSPFDNSPPDLQVIINQARIDLG